MADRSSQINSEARRATISAHIQPKATKRIERRMQMSIDPKHSAKVTYKNKEMEYSSMTKSVVWSQPNRACSFQLKPVLIEASLIIRYLKKKDI